MSLRDRSPVKTSLAIGTRQVLCTIWPVQELNHAMLVSSGQRRTAPRLSLVSPKVFYSVSVTDGVSGLLIWGCLADCIDTIGRELNWMMISLNHQWTDFNWKNDLLMSSCIINKLFSCLTVKLLWHDQYCIKCIINKGDLTWFYIL
jgi:hypothetical protein